MNKKMILGGLALAAVAVFAGAVLTGTSGIDKKGDVALVLGSGSIDDGSFNTSLYKGIKEYAKENKIANGAKGYTYFDLKKADEIETNTVRAAEQFKVVVGSSFLNQPAIETVSKKYPDTTFISVDAVADKKLKNVTSVMFKSEQSSYLAGIAAAHKAQAAGDTKVGFIGGMKSEILSNFFVGYEAGVKTVAPDMQVEERYVGDFTSGDKGKMIAEAMISQGVHVIMTGSGATDTAIINLANDHNKSLPADSKDRLWVIGCDTDRYNDGKYKSADGKSESSVLTTSLTNTGVALKALLNDKDFGGVKVYGLKEGGVGVTTKNFDETTKKDVASMAKAIKDGSFVVPEMPAGESRGF